MAPMVPTTPPKSIFLGDSMEVLETPAPMRARMQNLQRQVDELVRKSHAAEIKYRSDLGNMSKTVTDQRSEIDLLQDSLGEETRKSTWLAKDLERCKLEGEGMREELNLHSIVQQHKALLAVAQEQMQMVEMEQRLLQAESARIMRDHKLALFQAKEDDMLAEVAERDARIAELEVELSTANTSLSHQRAAENKAKTMASSANSDARAEVEALESKVERLEASVKSWKEKEKEARLELERSIEDKGKDGSTDKEKVELKTALRTAKNELKAKIEELADLQEEMASLKQSSKEREKTLKAKYREAEEERQRLAALEDDIVMAKPVAKKTKESPTKKSKPVKATRDDSDSEDDVPKKKKKADGDVPKPKAKPLHDSGVDNTKAKSIAAASNPVSKRKSPVPEEPAAFKAKTAKTIEAADDDGEGEGEGGGAVPVKKKTRKLLAAQPTFAWDPILSSGDGVIPTFLSPVKPPGKATIGTIPRAGFASLSSRRF